MKKERLEELRELQRTVKAAIAYGELGMMVKMSYEEKQQWKREFGDYDFVIGNFAVTNLSKIRKDL
jgi:hypothetical protein